MGHGQKINTEFGKHSAMVMYLFVQVFKVAAAAAAEVSLSLINIEYKK